jgi:hypothetical protein
MSAVHSSIVDKPFGPHRFTVSSQDWRACNSVRPLYGVASVLNVRPSTNLPRTPGSSYVEMTQLRTVPRPNNSSRLCRQIDMQSHANRLFFERKAKELNGLSQSVNETTTRYDTKSAMRSHILIPSTSRSFCPLSVRLPHNLSSRKLCKPIDQVSNHHVRL